MIEDNEDVADTQAELLSSLGHDVTVARTGQDGIQRVIDCRPQLVLCDIGLPDIDGVEVCTRVRALALGYCPTMVALTGWGQRADRERTAAAGFDHHLMKPVTFAVLQGLLEEAASQACHVSEPASSIGALAPSTT